MKNITLDTELKDKKGNIISPKLSDNIKNYMIDIDGTITYHNFGRVENPAIGSYTQFTAEVKLNWMVENLILHYR